MTGTAARKRILLVDDDPLVLRSLARVLRREFDIVVATSAADAIANITDGLFAVVTDHDLGAGPDGRTVLTEVRRRTPEARRVLVSGQLQALPTGDADLWHVFLTKPVQWHELFAALGVDTTP